MKIFLSRQKLFIFLLIINTALFGLFIFSQYSAYSAGMREGSLYGLILRFDVGREISIPTWYNQTLLTLAALLLMIQGFLRKANNQKSVKHWFGLAAVFILLSLDEGAMLHELLIIPMQNLFGIREGYFYFAWVIPVLVILVLLCLVFIRFYFQLPRDIKIIFAISFVIFISGAVGMEMLGGDYASSERVVANHGWDYVSVLLTGIEEWLEMTGIALFIYGILGMMQKENIHKLHLPAIKS